MTASNKKVCVSRQCDKKVSNITTGLCDGHQIRFRKGQETDSPLARREAHGQSYSKTYRSWEAMCTRCTSTTAKEYPQYGGKGINVCKRWLHSFSSFLEDMGERPEGTSIDRIDNNGNYEPSNCRWATRAVQQQNQGPSIRNATGQRGVSWVKRIKKYTAQIQANGKIIWLGNFAKLDEAIEVRKKAELKYWNIS